MAVSSVPVHDNRSGRRLVQARERFQAVSRASTFRSRSRLRWVGRSGHGVAALAAATGGSTIDLGAHGTYRADSYALVRDAADWRGSWFGWVDSARFETVSDTGKPIFVGVAKPGAIRRYLAGAGYTTVHERSGRTEPHGAAPAVLPAKAVDWTAQAAGTGTQTVRWTRAVGHALWSP